MGFQQLCAQTSIAPPADLPTISPSPANALPGSSDNSEAAISVTKTPAVMRK